MFRPMLLTPTDAVVVRQSKRDARLENMISFRLYIGEYDKMGHSNGWRSHFFLVSRRAIFLHLFTGVYTVQQLHSGFQRLNTWPDFNFSVHLIFPVLTLLVLTIGFLVRAV